MRPGPTIDSRTRHRIIAAGIVSLIAWLLLQNISDRGLIGWSDEMREAARRMELAITTVREYTERSGIPIDDSLDPNRTGLIGPEYTPLFTTLGRLEAKRTTTNPDLAALMVYLLRRAGVSEGDSIAVGSSASFPALLIVASDIAAVSLGGEGDVGAEFELAVRERLRRQIRSRGIPLIEEPDLRANVARRLAVYGPVTAFINIGGSEANLGSSPRVLKVEPGLNTELALPPASQRGVLFEMAARGVPVIHLLHIRGFARRYGLPWDPVPLPAPGSTQLHDGAGTRGMWFWPITAVYFAVLGVIAVARRDRAS